MIRAVRLLVFAACVAGFALPAPALAAPSCAELAYGTPAYQSKMDELAELAKLPGGSWNRYHEALVAGLCSGKPHDVDQLVDSGSVPAVEAVRIAAFLGIPYRPKPRSNIGEKYAASKTELIRMGVCAACADQIALYYTRRPSSSCAKLAKRALDGDTRAIDELVDFPDYCRWAYPGAR